MSGKDDKTNNTLSAADKFRLCKWVEKNKKAAKVTPDNKLADIATRELVMIVTASNIRNARLAVGVRKMQGSNSGNGTNSLRSDMAYLADELRMMRLEMGLGNSERLVALSRSELKQTDSTAE